MDNPIINIKKIRSQAEASGLSLTDTYRDILLIIPTFECDNFKFDRLNKREWKCSMSYTYQGKHKYEFGCGTTQDEAKNKAIKSVIDMLERLQMNEITSKSSESSSSNEFFSHIGLNYRGMKNKVIRCTPKSVGGLAYGLYYVNDIEPNDIRKEHLQTIIGYEHAKSVSKHPWIYISILFGNNLRQHPSSYYYIICGDDNDTEYLATAETMEDLPL